MLTIHNTTPSMDSGVRPATLPTKGPFRDAVHAAPVWPALVDELTGGDGRRVLANNTLPVAGLVGTIGEELRAAGLTLIVAVVVAAEITETVGTVALNEDGTRGAVVRPLHQA